MEDEKIYDCLVIGAGHAGTEAALAAARIGVSTALITISRDNLGVLSCNPAIGGVGKGQLVKEIDALGGEMAKAVDSAGIQFRILNASRGPAVHSSRAQIDRELYVEYIRNVIDSTSNLDVIEASVIDLDVADNCIKGVKLADGRTIPGRTVVFTPGTYLNGLIHIGLENYPGGRMGEGAVSELSDRFKSLGIEMMRFKTGTCARIDKDSIDYSKCEIQNGDDEPIPFSFSTEKITQKQMPCYITYTNPETHDIIRGGFEQSPLYTGVIEGTGVRYCPSIEDKIMRFGERERHHVFLEPEGYNSNEIYPNGISTSLPEDIQLRMIHSISGLENAKMLKPGYGIEHDVIVPTQLYPTLEIKNIRNLYFAGQVNGTTGYEEAGAQGLIAGINAALKVQKKEPLILDRATSYIGVLLDDLVTKGTAEPYRMFTSRVEYRLVLREDNADMRLADIGYQVGLLPEERFRAVQEKLKAVEELKIELSEQKIRPTKEVNALLSEFNAGPLKTVVAVEQLMRRPEITDEIIAAVYPKIKEVKSQVYRQAKIQIKYSGYIDRQLKDIEKFQDFEKIKIPADFDYSGLSGLSNEIQGKLTEAKPVSLGQAGRISGVTPAALMLLMIYLKKRRK